MWFNRIFISCRLIPLNKYKNTKYKPIQTKIHKIKLNSVAGFQINPIIAINIAAIKNLNISLYSILNLSSLDEKNAVKPAAIP